MAISGNQWQSVPINGNQRQSVAVRANQWQSEAISVLAGDDVLRPEWPACMEHFELLMPNVLRAEREWLLHRDERHLMRDAIGTQSERERNANRTQSEC